MKFHNFINFSTALLFSTATLLSPVEAGARSEYWHQRVTLFDLLPVEPGDIVFLGNSITDGGEFTELFDNPSIKNRGISSDVISGVKERLHQVTNNHPSKIFLLIGINDVSHNLTVSQLSAAYEDLVKTIRSDSPESHLYIQSLMPINNDFGRYKNLKGKENVIKALNEQLKEIAKRNGATYVDLWPALADKKTGKLRREFTNDGLHLLGKGYDAWAKAIRHLVTE
ncbi:MAG: sialate O-acetylesterase [Muribaculaceae bacterium]|nr:sialate O-acetylesterase [Muribaculaceae bacterium]MDE6768289.1 sialate O-acetylesterase [Muribaculaceae bacterium]